MGEGGDKSGGAKQVTYKVIIVGPGAVGKSALTLRFMYDEFVSDYEPTKADSYRKTMKMEDGSEVAIDILDTAGQEDYAVIRDNYIRSGQAFLCVFSVSERSTFEEMDEFREAILRVKEVNEIDGSDPQGAANPIILVGNKSDLADQRKVSFDEADAKAKTWGIEYIETSALKDENVKQVFETIMHKIHHMEKSKLGEGSSTTQSAKKKSKWKRKCTIL
ncbi:ras-related protein O-RAL-like [Symsagittifera roscoffensis]|uniref:ras-related protein O-RAL-like n=1 Tax=Symsagittifera roscoffensis TaxID=84072 RepID=UPI00307CA18A